MERQGSLGKVKNITKKELYDILKELKGKKIQDKFSMLEERLRQLTSCPEDKRSVITHLLKGFKCKIKKKITAASYNDERFLKANKEWLKTSLELPVWSDSKQLPGRPHKDFVELSDRSKRRRTKDLRDQVPIEELTFAARVKEGTSGNTDTSKMMKNLKSSPTRAKKYRKIISSAEKEPSIKKYTPQEALSLFVEGDFTRRQWELLQSANKSIYPCYSLLQKAKNECYPNKNFIKVTETSFEVELQALLDHTASRLCKYMTEVIQKLTMFEKQHLVLISKWGCGGSHQTQYKQKFVNSGDSDANIFLSSLVPVRLVVAVDGVSKKVIWQNPVPSSVRFCRPIRARFVHETKDVTKEEIAFIEKQSQNLKKTEVSTLDEVNTISHTLLLTMVDGKVCNAATDTASTMRCYICGQTSKDFNKLKKTVINEESLKFGLSILHARIRFFESLLHLSYKLPLKKWQARNIEEKRIVRENKETIQNGFKEEMGLLVDIPKAGYGNSNDGNTSRRFFENPEISSRITGINAELIKRFKVVLEVISSGHDIDHVKFDDYAQITAKMYTDMYGWYPMSPTVHKVLMHGAEVISKAILPIGQLSEEAAEARNKHFRKYRLDYARKFSRVECNQDIFNRLMLTSDPYLSSNRPKRLTKKHKPFTMDAMTLIIGSPSPENSDNDGNYDSDE